MKKFILAAALSLWMVLFAFTAPAQAQTTCAPTTLGSVCAIVTGSHLSVTLLGNTIISTTIPQTTIEVPVPGPTVRLPGVTVTAPGVTLPGSTVTRTSTVTVTVGPTGQNGQRTATITSNAPSGQSTGSQPSASPSTRVVHGNAPPQRTVTITRAKAFVLSLGLVLLGLLLAFLIMTLYYYLGWKGKERENKKFFNDLREDVFRITKG